MLAIRLGQPDRSAAEVGADRQACARYLALAESYTRTPPTAAPDRLRTLRLGQEPAGPRLREVLPVIHLRSDVERKRLFGLAADAHTGSTLGSGIYFPQATDWTYERLHRLAAADPG